MIDFGSLLAHADSGGGQANPGAAPQGGFWTDPSGTVRPWTAAVDPLIAAIRRRVATIIAPPRPVYDPASMSPHMLQFFPQDVPASPTGLLNPNPSLSPGETFVRSTPIAIMAALTRRQREIATRPRRINRGISLAELHRGLGLESLHPGIGTTGLHPGVGLREIHRGRGIIPREAIGP